MPRSKYAAGPRVGQPPPVCKGVIPIAAIITPWPPSFYAHCTYLGTVPTYGPVQASFILDFKPDGPDPLMWHATTTWGRYPDNPAWQFTTKIAIAECVRIGPPSRYQWRIQYCVRPTWLIAENYLTLKPFIWRPSQQLIAAHVPGAYPPGPPPDPKGWARLQS